MANEISVSTRLLAKKSFLNVDHNVGTVTADLSGSTSAAGIVSIPTSAGGTALSLDGITTATMGYAFFRNIDATYYIEIGVQVGGTFYALVKLKAGEVALLRMNQTNAPYARSNGTAANLQFTILAD